MKAWAVRRAFASLPLRPFEAIVGEAPLLVLSPHPDDESLGCGGLLAEAAARGQAAAIAWVTDGAASHPNRPGLAAARALEAEAAASRLGVPPERRLLLGAPDGAAPHAGPLFDTLVNRLEAFCRMHGIGTVCATWAGDPHPDHVATAKLASALAARLGLRHIAYPIWAWAAPRGADLPAPSGARLDVSRHRAQKRFAIAAHRTQHPSPLRWWFRRKFDRGTEIFLTP